MYTKPKFKENWIFTLSRSAATGLTLSASCWTLAEIDLKLVATGWIFSVTGWTLPVTGWTLPVAGWTLPATGLTLAVTCWKLLVTGLDTFSNWLDTSSNWLDTSTNWLDTFSNWLDTSSNWLDTSSIWLGTSWNWQDAASNLLKYLVYRSKVDQMALTSLVTREMFQINRCFTVKYYLDIKDMEVMIQIDQWIRPCFVERISRHLVYLKCLNDLLSHKIKYTWWSSLAL